MMPAEMTLATALPADSTSAKLAMMQRASGGLGSSLTVTSVITASIPSLPSSPETTAFAFTESLS